MSGFKPEVHESRGVNVAELGAYRASEQAWKQFSQAQSLEEFCGSWLLIQCQTVAGVSEAVVILRRPGTTQFAPVAFFPESTRDRASLSEVAERAIKEQRGIVKPVEVTGEGGTSVTRFQLAYPIRLDAQVYGVIGLDIDARPESTLQAAMRDLQWGSGWLEAYLRRHSDPMQAARARLKLALDVVATLIGQPGLKAGASAFTTELAARMGCDRVALGVLKGRTVKLTAVSHSAQFDHRANLLRAIEAAMEECIDQGETVTFPPERDNLPVVSHAHETLVRESGAGSAVTFPLVSEGETIGALSLERPAGFRFDVPTLEMCEALAAVAGPVVELKRQSEQSLPAHVWNSTGGLWRGLTGSGHAGLKFGALCAALVAAFLALATGDFRISGNATLEGVVQRAITAPFDGYVKEASFRAGDLVKAQQVIGRFDDRDLQLEKLKHASQREQYEKQYREAMAKHERAQIEVIGAQLAQADAQLALIEEQLSRIEMVAPFDGFVVTGDLSQNLGSPVQRGQVLFEVAPLDSFRIALDVEERDIAHVTLGQEGVLAVASMPSVHFRFSVVKITPVNVAKDGGNFFRVEGKLEDAPGRLRPGMEGVGKIFVDERKLVWIWTRAFGDWLRLWVWSWLP